MNTMKHMPCRWCVSFFVGSSLFLAGCNRGDEQRSAVAPNGRTVLSVWAHHGKPGEWTTIQAQVARFNTNQAEVEINLIEIAEANYDTQVQSAAASDALPDILEFDGPMLANYAWKGYLVPIDGLLTDPIRSDLLPSIVDQGTYNGKLYAVGTFDSGLGLYANRALLKRAGARIPSGHEDAWTIEEFNQLLARLAAQEKQEGADAQVLDLKRDYRGEWWTYGFYPILASAGADLIDRTDYQSATGTLNSLQAASALQHLQNWSKAACLDANADGRAFVDKRVAVSWVGHWEYPRYREALGDELLVLPLPNFGKGSRTAMGSWAWGVTSRCRNPEAAARFLEFLLRPDEILAIVTANGAVPATKTAIQQSELYGQGGPLRLFAEQLSTIAVPRPKTPAYPVITSAFQAALLNVLQGAQVQAELDKAALIIDRDIKDNEGYGAKANKVKAEG